MSSPKQRKIKEKVVKIYPTAKLRRRYGAYYRVFRNRELWLAEKKALLYRAPRDGWFRNADKAWSYAWQEIQQDFIERLMN